MHETNMKLRAELASKTAECKILLAACKICLEHFDALKADYDKLLAECKELEAQEPVAWLTIIPFRGRTHCCKGWHGLCI